MRLFIAEKPSVAKAIAEELGITDKTDGFITCGVDKVTWCFGHMLELAEPDEYTANDAPINPSTGKKLWRIEDLPIVPKTWIVNPKQEAQKQLQIIQRLLKDADVVVNAGDSDREGQLLIDEVLEHFHNTKPVLRFWVSAHDSVSLKRGLISMKDNLAYKGLGAAAIARGRADWLIGMNLSRAYTLSAQRGGCRVLFTVGRVQTPTLALVVARDRAIEAFQSKNYHTIKATIKHNNEAFIANWCAYENQEGLDEEGRLINTAIANALIGKFNGATGHIKAYEKTPKTQSQPRAYSLSDITLIASNQFGYTAVEVLETCQSLYETHKLTSYPRTDCAFLPESQHVDATKVLEAIKHVNPALATIVTGADATIKSKTWDDSKVGVHYGIIPTMHKGSVSSLNEKERTIYNLIARAYIAQFYPPHEYLSTIVCMNIAGEQFEADGKTIINNGWLDVYMDINDGKNGDALEQPILPEMTINDDVLCFKAVRIDTKTKAPARFTEGTLQRAMENVHTYITDPEHKKMLREGDGMGTPATRASIISELKRRETLETKGKHIVSTPLGRSIIDVLPEVVKSPVLTAMYERFLREIEQDATKLDDFIAKQVVFVSEQVIKANQGLVTVAQANKAITISTQHRCAICGKGLCRRHGNKRAWWSCSAYPSCKQTYPDIKGKPNFNQRKGITQ